MDPRPHAYEASEPPDGCALPGFSTGHLTLIPELRRREFDVSGHPINACPVGRVFRIGRSGFTLRGGRPEQSAGSLVNGVGLRLPSLRVDAHSTRTGSWVRIPPPALH